MPYSDPQRKLDRDRAYKATRRAELAAKQRAYYQAHREESDVRNRGWLHAHPEIRRAMRFANGSNRRARQWGSTEKIYGRDVKLIVGPCAYCGESSETWDHVEPLFLGGRNHFDNLVPSCHDCNARKSGYEKHFGAAAALELMLAREPAKAAR